MTEQQMSIFIGVMEDLSAALYANNEIIEKGFRSIQNALEDINYELQIISGREEIENE